MALSLVNTSWADGVTLTASALRSEFNNIYNNPSSLVNPFGLGTVGAPAVQIGQSDTGFWSAGTGTELDAAIAGVNYMSIQSGGTFTMANYDTGATGPVLILYHDSASPADDDIAGSLQFRAKDDGASTRIVGQIFVEHDDVTASTQDSTMFFSVMNAVNAGDVNTVASLSSLGVWTDASAADGKTYIGNIDDAIGTVKKLTTLGVYHGRGVSPDKVANAEKHYSSTAEEFFAVTGLGNDPAKGHPGIAPKDVAWLAVKMALELDERLSVLEAA